MRPELAVIATKQRGVFRRRQALAHYTAPEVDQRLRAGLWVVVRHGVYATAATYIAAADDPRAAHLLAAAARRLVMAGDTVLSHESAALFHWMDLLAAAPSEPRLTRHRPDGVGGMTAHGLYVAAVPKVHRVPGLPVTTAARTVSDCGRSLGREAAFVVVESALHLGLDRLAVLDVLEYCSGWPGSAQARDLVMLANPWSESALESRARLWFLQQGLPQPRQQRVVLRSDGGFVARVDFVWEEFRTVCETDGQKKYAGDDGTERRGPLWLEKLREDRLRDMGLEVVRGYWSDGDDGGAALAERLRRAFVRGLRAVEEPAYRFGPPEPPRHRPLSDAA